MLESIRPQPTWIRGKADIQGNEIVLIRSKAEEYPAFDQEHSTRLLFDLGNLSKLGEVVERGKTLDIELTDVSRAVQFAQNHGFLWYGSFAKHEDKSEIRESLNGWYIAGLELSISTAVYSNIRRSREEGSAEQVRSYLRKLRDAGMFGHIALPDDDNDLLDYASIQLAERLTRGMGDCTPTLSAGSTGDFRFGNNPSSLVGAANYQLALLVSRKKVIKECAECGEMAFPDDPRWTYHTKCGNRKRQRERREKQRRAG